MSNIHQCVTDPAYPFPDADIPEYIIQALEESVNLDIPSYNVSRDLNTHLELTDAKTSAFDHYNHIIKDSLINKCNN